MGPVIAGSVAEEGRELGLKVGREVPGVGLADGEDVALAVDDDGDGEALEAVAALDDLVVVAQDGVLQALIFEPRGEAADGANVGVDGEDLESLPVEALLEAAERVELFAAFPAVEEVDDDRLVGVYSLIKY